MMLKTLPKFLLAAFTFFIFQNLHAQTETEPNNTPATANTLALPGKITGASTPAGEVDWYKVTTTSDGQLKLTLTSTNSLNVTAGLYDKDGVTPLNNTFTTSGTSDLYTDGLAAGTYYIAVYAYYNTQEPTYTLADTLTAAPVANDKEPDSSRATALTLGLNSTTTGHIGYYYNNHRDSLDWYKFTTNGDGLIQLKLTSNNGSNVTAYLIDNNGTTSLGSVTTIGTSYLNVDGLAAGTYYIQVNSYYNNQFEPYTLTDSLFIATPANDKEPDSSKATALTLPLNSTTTGHIGYYYNNHRDSLDWYKFTTNGDGLVQLKLTSHNGSNVTAYLIENNGTTSLGSVTTIGTSYLNVDGLAAGTYYIQVNSYYNNQFEPYTLTDSLFIATPANDKEPDSSKATALTLPLNSTTTGHIGYYYNNHRDSLDWYKITTTGDGLVQLKLTSHNGSNVSAYLFDNNGTTVLGSVTTTVTSYLNVDGLAAGTYYIQVNSYYNTQFETYTLTDSLFTYSYAADTAAEPNRTAYQAKTLLANRSTPGHIGFYYNLQRDSTDWWKINYTGTSGNLNLTYYLEPLLSNGGINNVTFQVYKDTNAAPISNVTFAGASSVVNLTGLAQGYYYIYVTSYYNTQFEAYAIADTFTQVNIAQISINSAKTTINSSSCGTDSITYNLSASHSPYTVRLYKNGALYDSVVTIAATTTFKGLSAGSYYATVYGDGATDAAYSKSATSTATPPVPTALSTTNIGVHTATLNWTKLSCANYYTVQYRMVGTQTWTVINTKGDTSKVALTGLLPYTLYAWEVASVDTTKGLTFTSAFADSVTFRTLSDTAHIALTFKGAGSGCNNDTLRYTSTNSAAPYTVTLYRNGVVYGSPLSVTSVASFYNVPPGNYYAKSTGTGSGGSFGLSDTTQIVPPAPTGLDTTMVTPTTATLNWNAISCSNYFTIQYKVTGTTTWKTVTASTNSLMLISLMPDTKYTWHVSASDSFNHQTVTGVYSDTATFITSSILPVTFVSFNAVLNNNSAVLSWSTSNEINNKGFQVERSNDGAHFNSIGFVDAQYGHSILEYGFTDNNLISGSDYYRLKQIDVDGNYQYSKTIKLDFSNFAWSVNGNPVINTSSYIQLKLDRTAMVSIQVISLNGSVLQTIHKGNINAGNYTIPLTLSNASAGTYIVKLMVDNKSYTTKIIKQ